MISPIFSSMLAGSIAGPSSSLIALSVLSWLLRLFTVSMLFYLAVKLTRQNEKDSASDSITTEPKSGTPSVRRILSLFRKMKSYERHKDGVTDFSPIVFCFVIAGFLLYLVLRNQSPFPVEIHEQVSIIAAVPGTTDTWVLDSDEPEPARLDNFWFKCCPDFDCRPYVQPGYIAPMVKYEVHHGCESIRASGLGFFYHSAGETWWTKLDRTKEF